MNPVTEEIRIKLPKLLANVSIVLVFFSMSFIVSWMLSSINTGIGFMLQIGLLIVSGIFVVRTLFDSLAIIDKATGVFLIRLGIKEKMSRQRVFKDTAYIVATLLVAATTFPLFSKLPNFGPLLQEITTYTALGLILLFVYDIGRNFYRLTEKR